MFLLSPNKSFYLCLFKKKRRADEDKREAYARSKSSQNSFEQYFRSPFYDGTQKDMVHTTGVEVHHELTTITKTQIHNTDIALHRETVSAMIKILHLHNTLDHDMITTKKIPDPTVLLIDLLTDLLIDINLVIDIDHVLILDITTIL